MQAAHEQDQAGREQPQDGEGPEDRAETRGRTERALDEARGDGSEEDGEKGWLAALPPEVRDAFAGKSEAELPPALRAFVARYLKRLREAEARRRR